LRRACAQPVILPEAVASEQVHLPGIQVHLCRAVVAVAVAGIGAEAAKACR